MASPWNHWLHPSELEDFGCACAHGSAKARQLPATNDCCFSLFSLLCSDMGLVVLVTGGFVYTYARARQVGAVPELPMLVPTPVPWLWCRCFFQPMGSCTGITASCFCTAATSRTPHLPPAVWIRLPASQEFHWGWAVSSSAHAVAGGKEQGEGVRRRAAAWTQFAPGPSVPPH